MTSIKSNANVFARTQATLERSADTLKDSAAGLVKDAGNSAAAAGAHAADAAGHLAGAAANAVFATGAVLQGTADAFEASAHTAAAGAFAGVGVLGWAAENVSMAGRFIAKNVSEGFGALANLFTGVLKDGKTVTVRELAGDPNAVRFSEEMFGKAADQLNQAGDSMNMAWNSYVNAVEHAAGSAANVAMAAGHTAAVAGNLALAAGELGSAGVVKMAELGVRASAVAVEYAEKGMIGARDAAILAAQISAATANAMAVAGQGDVVVDVNDQIANFQAQLGDLQGGN